MQIQISWLRQKPTDLDLHCLQGKAYPGSAGQGLRTQIIPSVHRKSSLSPYRLMLSMLAKSFDKKIKIFFQEHKALHFMQNLHEMSSPFF